MYKPAKNTFCDVVDLWALCFSSFNIHMFVCLVFNLEI